MKITEATVDMMMPKENDGKVELDGVLSFTLHNAGTATVTINGLFTLAPGSSFNSGMPHPNVVISDTLRIGFGSSGTKKLEGAFVRLKGGKYSNYEHQAI